MVGYGDSEEIKGYKLFNPQTNKFIYSRFVIFYEQKLSPKYPINLQNIPIIHNVNETKLDVYMENLKKKNHGSP